MRRNRDEDINKIRTYAIDNGYITVRRAALLLHSSPSYARGILQLIWEAEPDIFDYKEGVLIYKEGEAKE